MILKIIVTNIDQFNLLKIRFFKIKLNNIKKIIANKKIKLNGCEKISNVINKVKNKKTISFLFKANGVSIFVILLITSSFNWDMIIARHNLSNAQIKKIDYLFELSLSDKTLPILDQNRDKLKQKKQAYKSYRFDFPWVKSMSLTERLDQRIENFKTKQKKRTWLSWNLSDQKTASYFSSN